MAKRYILDITVIKKDGADISIYHKYRGDNQSDLTPFVKLTSNNKHIISGQKQIFDFGFTTYSEAIKTAEFINALSQEYNDNQKYKKFAVVRKFYFK